MDVQDLINNLYSEINLKKEKALKHVVKELLKIDLDADSAKRLTVIKDSGNSYFEKFIWDYQKESEILLMEWDLKFPEYNLFDMNFAPEIKIKSPVALDGIL